MHRVRSDRVWTAVGVALALVVTAVCLYWMGTRSSRVPFLARRGVGEWILYPVARDLQTRPAARLDANFRKSFRLSRVPASATVLVRAFREFQMILNGHSVPGPSTPVSLVHWKSETELEVAPLLREGENVIEVRVENDKGPPALWLELHAGDERLPTDQTWEVSLAGGAWQPARAADLPMVEERYDYHFPEPISALRDRPWAWIFLSIPGVFAWLLWNRPNGNPKTRGSAALAWGAFAVAAMLWSALFLHNTRYLYPKIGFDVHGHQAYIDYLKDRGTFPRADEGWEMFQPPMYYATAAAFLKVAGVPAAGDDAAKFPLQCLGLLAGLLQMGFVFASLRLLFPGSPGQALVGLVLAAFLPMHLYMYQYTTNEGFAATWASASIYAALRIACGKSETTGAYIALGLALAAALGSKLTALVVGAVIFAVLLARLFIPSRRAEPRARGLTKWGLAVLLAMGVGGFHYYRLWRDFGNPFVANWDPELGLSWWQDPGYHSWEYFIRFGRVLTQPFLLGAHGLPDAMYSTLWGDGLLGGTVQPWFWPPWNMERMAGGYLLALVPTAAILVGFVIAAVVLLRHPRAEWFLLLGIAHAMIVAIVLMNLRLPYLSLAKAFFGMSAAVPLCALGSWGLQWLSARSRVLGVLLSAGVSAWALNAFLAVWILPDAIGTERFLGWSMTLQGRGREGYEHFQRVLAKDPLDHDAHFASVYALTGTDQTEERLHHRQEAMRLAPADPGILLLRAMDEMQAGNPAGGLPFCEKAISVAPDYANAYSMKALLLEATGEEGGILATLREGLRVAPTSAELQEMLGARLLRDGLVGDALPRMILAAEIHALQIPRNEKERRETILHDLEETRALAKSGRPSEALLPLGFLFVRLNQWDAGLLALETAAKEARQSGRMDFAEEIEKRIRAVRAMRDLENTPSK